MGYLSKATLKIWWPVSSVILLLIIVNVVAFAASAFLPHARYDQLLTQFALSPGRLVNQADSFQSEFSILFSFVSHAFLHSDSFHLIVNMFWLYVFGQPLAVRFGAAGDSSAWAKTSGAIIYLAFYLSAAVFSGIAFALVNLSQPVLLIGASGAISAVTAAAIRVTLRRYQPQGLSGGKSLSVFDWKIVLMTLLYIGSNVVLITPFGGALMFGRDPLQIAWEAHVAGFLYGLLMFSFFDRLTTRT